MRDCAELVVRETRVTLGSCACALVLLALIACTHETSPTTRTEYVLGTECTITTAKGGSQIALDAAFARLHQIDDEFSVTQEGTEVDAVNAAAGSHPVKVSEDVYTVMKKDISYSILTDGGFDPSVGPLVKLWGIGTAHARVPAKSEIEAALALVNWKDIVLDDSARTIFLKRQGMALDFGSTTKGYAADEVVKLLQAHGVSSAIIDLGGNIFAMGQKPDGSPWRIGIQNPEAARGTSLGVVSVRNKTVVTSGVYEHFFIKDGKRYHHILDLKTGFPVDNGLTSVTVITDKSVDADGFTTSLFIVGRERGMELARKAGVDVIFVDDKHRVYLDPGVAGSFVLDDPSFMLAK